MSETNGYATLDGLFQSAARRETDFEGRLGKFRIQSLTDLEKSRLDALAINSKGKFNRHAAITANARLIVACCVLPKFTESHIAKIQELDAAGVEELAAACRDHCGFNEEPEKNYDTTDSVDSPTS
jgi:hypothetical protein